ncbi:E3 ubiquitin-protein ligase rnf8 [Chamberlinius hualienensis]
MSSTLEAVACLCRKKNASDVNAPESFPLTKPEMTVGRGGDSDIVITAGFVSRLHAVISKSDNSWNIIDKSCNGLFVNGGKLVKEEVVNLQHNDVLSFGPNVASDLSYVFQKPVNDSKTSVLRFREKRPRLSSQVPLDVIVISDDDDDNYEVPSFSGTRKSRDSTSPDKITLLKENMKLEKKLKEMKAELEKKNIEALKEMERKQMEMRLKEHEFELKLKMNTISVQQDLDSKLQTVAAELKAAKDEKELLQNGLRQLEANKTRELAMELERAGLEWTLTEKEKLCEELKLKLIQTEERLKAQSAFEQKPNQMEDDLTKKVSNSVENELQCSICSEIFIKAVTLACAHSFCEYCINQWKKTKQECPMCRKSITSSVPSLALDNFISQYMATQSADAQDRRKETVTERQAAVSAASANIPSSSSSGRPFRRATRSNTNRSAGNIRGGIEISTRVMLRPRLSATVTLVSSTVESTLPMQRHAIDLSSAVDVTTDDEDWSSDSHRSANTDSVTESETDSGILGAYYGGYGNCYNCGRRGHWANGCPYY